MENFSSIAVTETCAEIPALGPFSRRRKVIWENMKNQREDGQFCDVILQCKGGTLYAHKSVLSSLSPYFKALFTTLLSDAPAQYPYIVDFKDFSVEAVGAVLDIVYSSGNIRSDHLLDIMRFCEYIQNDWLAVLVVDKVGCFINPDNVLDWYNASKEFRINQLTPLTQYCIRENANLLRWKAWECSIDINHIIKLAFQQELPTKEVVVMQPYTFSMKRKDRTIYVVDPQEGEYYPCKHTDLLRLRSYKQLTDIRTTFIHEKIFYIVCTEPGPNYLGLMIWKYQHCAKIFERAYFLDFAKVYSTVPGSADNTFFQQVFYDGYGGLFMEFENVDVVEFYFFKFDLSTGTFYDGFMTSDDGYLHKFFGGKPTYVLGPNYIINVGDFDFRRKDYHTSVKEYLNPDDVISELGESTGEMMEELIKHYRFTKKGCYWIYCADDGEPEKRFLILELDVVNLEWNPFCSFVGNYADSFVCGDTLYMICMENYDKNNPVVKKVLYLDEDNASAETANFDTIPLFRDSFLVPHHIL